MRCIVSDPIGVAILGCGYWGINYVRVFSELPEARVVAVCDQRTERLHEIGRRFPGIQLTTTVEETLDLEGIDAVVVCTPAKTHHGVARQAMLARKHVLIEKPITTLAADADDLIAVSKALEVTLMVGHTFIYNPGVQRVKEYMSRGAIGQVYYLYARRTNLGPIRHDVNALWDLAPHDISIFNYLLGKEPTWVSAVGAKVLRNHREDVGFISLGYSDGIIGHVHVSWAEPNKVREVVIVGSDKRIVFDDLNPLERVRVFDKGVTTVTPEAANYGEFQFLMRDGDIVSPRVEVSEPLRNQCSHFLACVRHGERPLTNGWEGRAVVRVMEAIDRSMARQGAPVEIGNEEQYDYREVGDTRAFR